MTFTNVNDIIELIKYPAYSKNITEGILIKKHHELHVLGKYLDEFLVKIVGYENDLALKLKKQLVNAITVPIYSNALTPFKKVMSSRSVYRNYEFVNDVQENKFYEILTDIEIKEKMNHWINTINIDPNGISLIEIEENGLKAEPKFYSIEQIRDITPDIEYIIFQPFKINKDTYVRVIDDRTDYLFRQIDYQNYTLVPEKTFIHGFSEVPACFVSTKKCKKNTDVKDSYISESLIFADDYLFDYSNYKVYKVKQAIPYVWEYQILCKRCGGARVIETGEECPVCHGSGFANHLRDVADKFVLSVDSSDFTPPAGFVQPDLATWVQMETTLDKLATKINTSIWGNNSALQPNLIEKTATGIQELKKNENSVLSLVSENASYFEGEMTEYLAEFYFPQTTKRITVSYNKIYNDKSNIEVLADYVQAKKDGCNDTILTNQYEQYLQLTYENNETELNRQLNILKTKPYFHYLPVEITTIIGINPVDVQKNLQYNAFAVEFELTKNLAYATIPEINIALTEYVNKQNIKQEPEQPMQTEINTNNLTKDIPEQEEFM